MINLSAASDDQLRQSVKQIFNHDGWRCLEELLNREIERGRDKLESLSVASDAILIAKMQSHIKAMRFILTLCDNESNI